MKYDTIIVGGGLAGVCSALWLSKHQRVLLLEGSHQPSGASQVSAGLINPFSGLRGRLMWRGLEALENLDALVCEADAAQCYNSCGVLRLATSQKQAASFREVASAYPDYAAWINVEKLERDYPGTRSSHGALRLYVGGTMNTPCFIDTVLSAAIRQGAVVMRGQHVVKWSTISDAAQVMTQQGRRYHGSHILLCLGDGYRHFKSLRALNLHRIKGQVVHLPKPSGYPLSLSVSGHGYVVSGPSTIIVGTTYERDFSTDTPTDEATKVILDTASTMIPGLNRLSPLQTAAAVRVGVPGTRLPMIGPVAKRIWIFTGLGSKGILFASLLSRWVPKFMEDPTRIPHEVRVVRANSRHLGQHIR